MLGMRNLFVQKKDEMEFLRKLEKYFKDIPQKDILQKKGYIEKGRMGVQTDTCGSFTAHISKMLEMPSNWETIEGHYREYYCNRLGRMFFRENISEMTEKIFNKHATFEDMYDGDNFEGDIFSAIEWREHPYKVIKKVIKEVENDN